MEESFDKIIKGYDAFRKKYASADQSVMQYLSTYGQQPKIMVVACCDSRVDPALILQCDPGDLFVVRNVANIVPNYEKDDSHHGTSAALEFGIRYLNVKHLILLGHSQCNGIYSLLNSDNLKNNDFINNWVSLIKLEENFADYNDETKRKNPEVVNECSKNALKQSYQNCLTFPWIREKLSKNLLKIHLWFFDIKMCQIFSYSEKENDYKPLH